MRLKKSRLRFDPESDEMKEDVNPMNHVSNMADAMLVLAVGIMLALVMAWKLDLSQLLEDPNAVQVELSDAEELSPDTSKLEITDNEEDTPLEDYGLTEYGKVYVDENGDYYVIEN